jgi:small nuclear ribonucleoprotein (snRNP)-like protein
LTAISKTVSAVNQTVQIIGQLQQTDNYIRTALNNAVKQVIITLQRYTAEPNTIVGTMVKDIENTIRSYDYDYRRVSYRIWNDYGLNSSSVMSRVSGIDSPVIVSSDNNGNSIITTATERRELSPQELETYITGILTSPDSVELSKLEKSLADTESKRTIMSIKAKKSEIRSALLDYYNSQKKINFYKQQIDKLSNLVARGAMAGDMKKYEAEIIALNALINAEVARQFANINKIQAVVASNNISYEEVQRINLLKAYESVKGNKK